MTQQLLSPSPLSPVKGQFHLLLLQGLGYLLPLTLLSGGAVIAQSSSTSPVKPLPSLNEDQPASPLEPIQASETVPQKPALPDYESVSPLRVNEPESEETAKTSQPQAKPELKPIQPLVNSPSHSTPQDSSPPQPSPSPSASPEVAESSQPSAPTVNLEPRPANSQNNPPQQQDSGGPVWQRNERTATGDTQDFVDFNGYPPTGENSLPAPRVEVSDRAENCTTVVEDGKLVSGSCKISQDPSESQQAAVDVETLPELPKNFQQPTPPKENQAVSTYTPPEDLPQLKLPDNGDSALMFPLARSMPVSSNYGWRIHPIYGNRRFHTGTDFTAPEGTPVVATKSGRVVLADYSSGYGLIVGLRHNDKNESRYAHLSQIHVKPGQWVEQGTVIGRVGNTGLSTGPHLHFEWRIRKGSRWIAVNAGKQLLMAKANLDPSAINFSNLADSSDEVDGNNFLAFLPEMLTAFPTATASWMSLPELPFLKKGNFKQAYERKADLAPFSQRSNSVLVLPFSLPKVLASLFNWQPPQLFTQEDLQRVPTANQINFQTPVAYRPPSPASENYAEVSQFLSEQESLESLTNLEALGTLNFPAPRPRDSQQLSRQEVTDSHVQPKTRD
ncbi:Peptidase M23 [Halothece sp. PCC 7418]|uniref:M23 family metallopeptidase n=1 Tax=Halothece sp. (strain PCC 7418) TaxID=65093 RepID=UPI0002A08AFF|nr:M23 family metallopeptidase [Halothece sp. PCC 7418]AFZ43321.1 Peptidase M23 [Halothece sp. PCC 7418]